MGVARAAGSGVQSVDRALDLLDHLALATHGGLSASELSRRTGLAYATVHRLMGTLVDRGYVRQEPGSKVYMLGPQMVVAGSRLTQSLNRWLQPYLTQLMEFSGETANVAMLVDGWVTYVAQVQSQQQLRMFTQVGNRVLPHATAVGKVLLARQPRSEAEKVLGRLGMPARTTNTITDLSRFLEELDTVSNVGHAVDDQEGEMGVRCVAVALFGVGDTPTALSVSGPAARLDSVAQARLVPQLHQVAASIAASLGPGRSL